MQKAIVIGATSGIGRELAELLAENNYQVGITGRRKELLESLKKEKPNSFLWRAFDVLDTKATIENLEALIAELGGLDLLVICSGMGDVNRDLDFEIEKKAIDLNVVGFNAICDRSFKYFENQKHGHLTAITSIAGLRGSSLAPAYSATKSFQIKYMESLRLKAKGTKLPIFITDIRPGFVDTSCVELIMKTIKNDTIPCNPGILGSGLLTSNLSAESILKVLDYSELLIDLYKGITFKSFKGDLYRNIIEIKKTLPNTYDYLTK